jgi:LCP family protein required for cell wall assembly
MTGARGIRRLVGVLAALVSITLLSVVGYAWKNMHDLDAGLQTLQIGDLGTAAAGPPRSGAPSGAADAPVRDLDGTAQNILVVGNDDRSDMTDREVRALRTGRDGGSLNTDTMMIVHIPADGSNATIISLPRDSYVQIPGFQSNKLNAAYPDGYTYGGATTEKGRKAAGAGELIRTVRNLTGLTIDHFVQVDLIGFYRISEAIGPIPVTLCHATSDPTGSHFSAPAGKQSLVGVRALEFVRQRDGLVGGDVARTARQRYFLAAAFRKIVSLGMLLDPGKLHNLIKAVTSSLYVDNAGFSIEQLAAQLAELSPNAIRGQAIPTGQPTTIDGQSVLPVNPAQVRRFVQRQVNGGAATGHPARGRHRHAAHHALDAGCIN